MGLREQLSMLQIRDKQSRIIRLIPNWAQEEVLDVVEAKLAAQEPVRIMTLKSRQLGMCLDPSTRVLTSDLRWVPIGDVEVGEDLVSVDEYPPGGRGRGRKMIPATVEARREVYEPAFRLTMDNGETLVATSQHRFLGRRRSGPETVWRAVSDTRIGDVVRYITQPWGAPDYEDGWFSGFLDGEGSLALKSRAGAYVCVAQRAGVAYERAVSYLKSRGYEYRVETDERKGGETSKFGNEPVYKLAVSRMNEVFRLIGQTRPARFIEQRWWEGKDLPGKKSGAAWSKVLSIEPLPPRRMIDLQTSSKTFIAEGFVSHNSTLAEALLFLWALCPNTSSGVVADEREKGEELFAKFKVMYEGFPLKKHFPVKYNRRNMMQFEGSGSDVRVMTAERRNVGRSYTFHAAHLSEVAFWPNPAETMVDLAQAIPNLPGTLVIMESTANGIGNFFEEEWQKAVAGRSSYVPLFFPWWREPGYIPCEGAFCLDGTCDRCQIVSRSLRPRDAEERELVSRFQVDRPHLAWRRWCIDNKCWGSLDMYHQEYPSTAEEAFVVSGVNAFPKPLLDAIHEPLRPAVGSLRTDPQGKVVFRTDPQGPLRIFRWPSKDREWGVYFIGADPSYGAQDKSDYAAAQVLNRRNLEQVAVWQGRVNPYAFADQLALLGRFYNDAMIAPEVEGGGLGTIGRLIEIYPHLWRHTLPDRPADQQKSMSLIGWSSNYRRKAWAITQLGAAVESNRLTLHDTPTYKEMLGYVFYGTRAGDVYEASTEHDDLVMALAIAVVCESTEPPLSGYQPTPKRPDGVILPPEDDEEIAGWA